MVVEHRGHASSVLALVFVAGLILGGLVTVYVLNNEIHVLNDKIVGLESMIAGVSVNQTVLNQNMTVFLNETAYSVLYAQVRDSVVLITGTTGTGLNEATVQGSGFVYNLTGSMVVVTNNHVVSGARDISVAFSDGNAYAAVVNGTDVYSDLAVLWVPSAPLVEFRPLQIASSSLLKVGDPVVAIGNPYGLTGTMTTGVVSALGRTITEPETAAGNYAIGNIIQTSTPINPGNSGGPLLNLNGSVVGITTAIVAESQGVGFAVPSDTVRKEVPYLAMVGSYDLHPYLGVVGTDMDYDTAVSMGVNVTYGWLINSVNTSGPADQAGVRANDIIIGLNGTRIINGDALTSWLEQYTLPHQTVLLTVSRDNQTLPPLPLVLGTRPPP